ncbi:HBR060Cp [Eremothecium sinecaudum]|uniref:HBR060Cp n=1 Tax=Eremothecium sinecaudum TaxID=45286 RepID=A0A120K142_9SACH|nr:HBR060Cp [Eremothecium sinecaudum]AMD18961.1 HBR060Cp [Eremothecium sinecaudum]
MPPVSARSAKNEDKRTHPSSTEEIKFQLEQIQKQLDESRAQGEEEGEPKQSNLPFSSMLSRRDARSSMPVFAGSNVHNGVLKANSGKDMNFVVGLSENLLLECRRLQAENEMKSVKLKGLQLEHEQLQASFSQLNQRFASTSKEDAALKDVNWELEMKLQTMSQEFADLSELFGKNKKALQKQIDLTNEVKTELEAVSLQKDGLQSALEGKEQKFLSEITELKQHIGELNEENEQLNSKIELLTSKVETLTNELTKRKDINSDRSVASVNATDGTNNNQEDSERHSLDIRGTQVSQPSTIREGLEYETLKADLTHATQTISKLRQQILRLKADKTAERSSVRSGKSKRKLEYNLHPSERTESALTVDGLNDTFDEPASLRDISRGTFSDLNFGSDVETSSIVSDTQNRNPLASIFDSDSNDEVRLELQRDEVEAYAKSHNLVILTEEAYKNLQFSLSDSSKSIDNGKDTSLEDEMVFKLQTLGYKVLSKDMYEELNKKVKMFECPTLSYLESKARGIGKAVVDRAQFESLENPSVNEFIRQAKSQGLEVLSTAEHKKLIQCIENPSLEYLTENLKKYHLCTLSEQDYACFKNPTLSYLSNQSRLLGKSLIDTEKLHGLTKPTIEQISFRASELKHVLLPKDTHDRLINPSKQMVEKYAASYDDVLVSLDEYEALQSPSLATMQEKLDGMAYTALPIEDLSKLRNEIANPGIDQLQLAARKNRCILLKDTDYENLIRDATPSLENIKKHMEHYGNQELLFWLADKLSYQAVPLTEYKDLINQTQNPSIEFLSQKAASYNYVFLERNKYHEMLHMLENPTDLYLETKCGERDQVVVNRDDYEFFKQHIEAPKLEFMSKHAAKLGFTLIERSALSKLNDDIASPSLDYLRSKSATAGYKLLTSEEYEKLKELAETPPLQHIRSKATLYGLATVEQSEYQRILRKSKQPTQEELKDFARKLDQVVLSFAEYQKLNSDLQSPSLDYLVEKAATYNRALLSNDELSRLRSSVNNPTLTYLSDKARSLKHVILPSSHHAELNEMAYAPTMSHLELKAKEKGSVVVSSEKYESILANANEPSLEHLMYKAKEKDYVVIPRSEHSKLIENLEHPSLEHLKHIARDSGNVVISMDKYSQMLDELEKPTLDYLKLKAASQDHIVVPNAEYESLQNTVGAPTMEFLQSKVLARSCVMVPSQDYKLMIENNTKPTLEYLNTKAKAFDCVVVSESDYKKWKLDSSEYSKLLKTLTPSSLQLLKEHGIGYQIIPLDEYNQLVELSSNPPLDFLTKSAKSKGFSLVATSEYDKLLKLAFDPTDSDIAEKLRKTGHIMVLEDTYESMRRKLDTPPESYLEEKAKQRGMVLITAEEYKETARKINDKDSILASVRSFGYEPVSCHELESLKKSSIERAELSELQIRLVSLGYVSIRKSEYDDLNAPTIERVNKSDTIKLCKRYDLKPVPLKEYEKLKEDSQPYIYSADELITMVESNGSVVVSEAAYTALKNSAESPTLEEVAKHASAYNMGLVDKTQYSQLLRSLESPSVKELELRATSLGMKLLENDKYVSILKVCDTPSKDFLERKASDIGYVLMKTSERNELVEQANNPSIAHLTAKASAHSMLLLDQRKYDEIYQKAEFPTLQELESKAASLKMRLVLNDEYENLVKKATEPELSFIKTSAAKLGYLIISKDEYKLFQHAIGKPQLDELTEQIKAFDCVIMQKSDADRLLSTVANPTEDFIAEKAATYGKVLTDRTEFEEYSRNVLLPDVSFISGLAKKLDYVLISEKELNKLNSLIEEPDLSYLSDKAHAFGKHLVDAKEHTKMLSQIQNPTYDCLVSLAKKINHVVIPEVEHGKLINHIQNPSDTYLNEIVASRGNVVITSKEFGELLTNTSSPSLSFLEKHAKTYSRILVDESEIQELSSAAKAPSLEHIKEKAEAINFEVIEKGVYETLVRHKDAPTLEFIINHAKAYDHVVIEKTCYEELQAYKLNPSFEALSELASKFDCTVLHNHRYEEMTKIVETPSLYDLKVQAKKLDKTLVDQVEYSNLLQKIEAPDLEYLNDKAKLRGLTIVDSVRYNELLEISEKPSIDFIDNHIQRLSRIMLSRDEYNTLKDSVTNPDIDFLTSKAKEKNLTMVSSDVLASMESNLTSPSEDFLCSKAAAFGKILVDKDTYEKTNSTVTSPPLEFLKAHAAKLNKVIVDSAEWNVLQKQSRQPSEEFLSHNAEILGKTLIGIDSLKKLRESAEKPSWQTIKSIIHGKDFCLVEAAKYKILEDAASTPSIDIIRKNLDTSKYCLLNIDEYNRLIGHAENPTIEDVRAHAFRYGYDLLKAEELVDFGMPTNSRKTSLSLEQDQMTMKPGNYFETTESVQSVKDNMLDRVSLSVSEYEQLKNPSKTTILEYASNVGLLLLDKNDFKNLKNIQSLDMDTMSELAEKMGFKLLAITEYKILENKASKLENISQTEFEEIAESYNMVAIPTSKYYAIMEEVKDIANLGKTHHMSRVLANKEYFERVIRQESTFSSREKALEPQKPSGLIKLSAQEYRNLLTKQNDYELSKADVYAYAKLFNLVVLTSEEYKALKLGNKNVRLTSEELEASAGSLKLKSDPSAKEGKLLSDAGEPADTISTVTTEAEFFDACQSNVDFRDIRPKNSISSLSMYTDALDLHGSNNDAISVASTIRLESTNASIPVNESLSALKLRALSMGYNLVPLKTSVVEKHKTSSVGDTSGLQERSLPDFPGMVHDDRSIRTDSESLISAWDEGLIFQKAKLFGLEVITKDEFEDYKKLTEQFSSEEGLIQRASEMGLNFITNSELERMRKYRASSVTFEDLDNYLESKGKCAVALTELHELREQIELLKTSSELNKETILKYAPVYDLAVLPAKDYRDMLQSLKQPMVIEDVIAKGQELGYAVIPKIKEKLPVKEGTVDDAMLESYARENDKVLLDRTVYQDLKVKSILVSSTPIMTVEMFKEKAKDHGLVALPIEEYNTLKKPVTVERASNIAKEYNSVLIPKEEYGHLLDIEDQFEEKTPITREELVERAREFGLAVLDNKRFQKIKSQLATNSGIITANDLIAKAAEFDLVPIHKDQFEQIKLELESPTLTKEQIVQQAVKFDLVAIDLKEYARMKRHSRGSFSGILDTFDMLNDIESVSDTDNLDSQVKSVTIAAKKLGLLCIPESSFVATSFASVPDVENVVVLPTTYYNKLITQGRDTLERFADWELQSEIKRRGIRATSAGKKDNEVNSSGLFGATKLSKFPTSRSSISVDSRRRNLVEMSSLAIQSDLEQSRGTNRLQSSASSITRNAAASAYDSTCINYNNASPGNTIGHSRRNSIDMGFSLMTMASLSEPSIIPALTQTVIGEYLYKYYRRLGRFSSQSNLRHERYFWVHPYTLTLYWSTSNPVLDNPGAIKTRAAAIIGVDSVNDPNPFPAGLYNRSIIVKTESRELRLTCPTRQRHNIWFNALRYLVQRNMDGINLEDVHESAGRISFLPGEDISNAASRLSTTRVTSNSSKQLRRSGSMFALR